MHSVAHLHPFKPFRLQFSIIAQWTIVAWLAISSYSVAITHAEVADGTFDDTRGDFNVDQDQLDKADELFFEGLTAYQSKQYKKAAVLFSRIVDALSAYHINEIAY